MGDIFSPTRAPGSISIDQSPSRVRSASLNPFARAHRGPLAAAKHGVHVTKLSVNTHVSA
ncbi:MAG: hypothetical protein EBY98_02810 [Acidimicrobiia bacterium]|nr:hypothetical protein [Acidimicrobiia bacterium]